MRGAWLGVALLALGLFVWLFRYELEATSTIGGVAYRLDRWTGRLPLP